MVKKTGQIYDEDFYAKQADRSYKSAMSTLPLLFNYFQPKSVVGVGCGVGTWLKACLDLGISELHGMDGNQIADDFLFIPRSDIDIVNLDNFENTDAKKYDLAISLEVAEHLPETSANNFVLQLTSFSDVVLFSAAIPYQSGTNHINEQPLQYWVKKFNNYGYECFDFLRSQMSGKNDIDWWYSQNILIFVKNEKVESFTNQGLNPTKAPLFFYLPEIVDRFTPHFEKYFSQTLTCKEKILIKILTNILPSKRLRGYLRDLKRKTVN